MYIFKSATKLRDEKRQFEIYKQDYENLSKRLSTLADKTTHSVMVPIGPLAFMPGKLIHTNEILVLLGDNWFAERSAKQAVEIVNRRALFVQERLASLQKDLQNMEARVALTSNLLNEMDDMESGDLVHIVEEYDDDESQEPSKSYTITNNDIHQLTKENPMVKAATEFSESSSSSVAGSSGSQLVSTSANNQVEQKSLTPTVTTATTTTPLKPALKNTEPLIAKESNSESSQKNELGQEKEKGKGKGKGKEKGKDKSNDNQQNKSVHFHPVVKVSKRESMKKKGRDYLNFLI